MSKPKVLYHYCSTEAFKAIIETRSIHLSSITLSNDSEEGKLLAAAFRRVAARNKASPRGIDSVIKMMEGFADAFDGLAFCLSEDADLLSQWRGYAANATGVAIGFSVPYLSELSKSLGEPTAYESFTLGKVVYDARTHDRIVEQMYLEMEQHFGRGAFEDPKRTDEFDDAFAEAILDMHPRHFLLKSHAFREELEWRLVSSMYREDNFEPQAVSFRACGDKLIPFRRYELKPMRKPPIVEVVLGPKHATPTNVIEAFLAGAEYTAKVRRSEATYR